MTAVTSNAFTISVFSATSTLTTELAALSQGFGTSSWSADGNVAALRGDSSLVTLDVQNCTPVEGYNPARGVECSIQWGSKVAWDEAGKQLLAFCSPPGAALPAVPDANTLVRYDELTNAWTRTRNPAGGRVFGHVLDNNAFYNGKLYKFDWTTKVFFEFDVATATVLRTLPGVTIGGASPSACIHPGIGTQGALIVSYEAGGLGQIRSCNLATGAWTTLSSSANIGDFPLSHYNATDSSVIVGGGLGATRQFYRIPSTGVPTALATVPIEMAVYEGPTHSVAVANPYHASSLVYHANGNIYALDYASGTFLVASTIPTYWRNSAYPTDPFKTTVACSIPGRGVLFVQWRAGAANVAFLHKPPSIPAQLTNLSVTSTSSSTVSLGWTAVSGATSYRVYRDTVFDGTSATTAYTDSGLTAATSYAYTVSAVNAQGVEGPQSESVTGTTLAASGVTPLFEDGFEYDITRSGTSVPQSAVTSRGWAGAKAYNFGTYEGPWGFVYTTACPSPRTGRALALEAIGEGGQTDFYIQYGNESSPVGFVPADLWMTWWGYSVPGSIWEGGASGGGGKFWYPTRNTWPVAGSAPDLYAGMLLIGGGNELGPGGAAPPGGYYITFRTADGDGYYVPNGTSDGTKLFQNTVTTPILAGVWTQIKVNLSTPVGGPGGLRIWKRSSAGDAWTLISDWRAGITPDFVWPLTGNHGGGHRAFRMPTIITNVNNTMLLDDFAMYNQDPG